MEKNIFAPTEFIIHGSSLQVLINRHTMLIVDSNYYPILFLFSKPKRCTYITKQITCCTMKTKCRSYEMNGTNWMSLWTSNTNTYCALLYQLLHWSHISLVFRWLWYNELFLLSLFKGWAELMPFKITGTRDSLFKEWLMTPITFFIMTLTSVERVTSEEQQCCYLVRALPFKRAGGKIFEWQMWNRICTGFIIPGPVVTYFLKICIYIF